MTNLVRKTTDLRSRVKRLRVLLQVVTGDLQGRTSEPFCLFGLARCMTWRYGNQYFVCPNVRDLEGVAVIRD